jgi:hypothetical protein
MIATQTEPRTSSLGWCEHFRANADNLLSLPWTEGANVTTEERLALAESLQDFQLGESSEGLNLRRAAAEHAVATADPDYVEAMRLFIAEEQRHSGDLGRYLDLVGIPRLKQSGTDNVFRWLRRRAGLELFITVLVTAELIGQVYYTAVYRATRCPLLRRLCAQLLRDEVGHVRFHTERLGMIDRRRPSWRSWLARGLHRMLLWGTALVVWRKHRQAFQAGGFGFADFWSAVWQKFRLAFSHRSGVRPG